VPGRRKSKELEVPLNREERRRGSCSEQEWEKEGKRGLSYRSSPESTPEDANEDDALVSPRTNLHEAIVSPRSKTSQLFLLCSICSECSLAP
jgi:hypothetical protein